MEKERGFYSEKQNIMEIGGSGSNCRCHGNEYSTGDAGTGGRR